MLIERENHGLPLPSNKIANPWVLFSIICVTAYALPLINTIVTGAQYLQFANESIAYRYFISARILSGEGTTAWLPQGQLVTLLQHFIILWIKYISGLSPADIQHTLQAFGLATCAITTGLGGALLIYGTTSANYLSRDKLLIAFSALVPLYITQANGFYYSSLPDYYFMTMVLALAYVVLFIRLAKETKRFSLQDALWLGIFCGASLANKITLAALAGAIGALIAIRAWKISLVYAAAALTIFGGATIVGFLAVFFGVYLGRIGVTFEVLQSWYDFGKNAGREFGFEQFLNGLFVVYNYHLIAIGLFTTLVFCGAATFYNNNQRTTRGILLAALGAMTAFICYAVYRRPAGTTLFEASVLLTAIAAMALSVLPSSLIASRYTIGLVSAAFGYAAFTFHLDFTPRSKTFVDTAWQIHNATLQINEPWVLLIPDNSYGWGGVEELIVKGTSDFGWNEVVGAKRIRDQVAPGMIFRRSPESLDAKARTFLWITKANSSGEFVENSVSEASHQASWALLLARSSETGSRCQNWTPVPDHRVTMCVLSSPLKN